MRALWILAALGMAAGLGTSGAAYGEVKMKTVEYKGWENCITLSNGSIELVVTTDVGPRVIRFGYVGGQNLMKEYEEQIGETGGDEWRIYGGHRLWHAPEAKPRTYALDNSPVPYEWDGKTLTLAQAPEAETGIQKEIAITLDPDSDSAILEHRLTNRGLWPVKLSPWCLTVMAEGGRAIFPQEPYRAHEDYLLPARPLVLWHYTDMQDARTAWGTKYIQLKQDPEAETKQKFGLLNKQGWAAYTLGSDVFVKRFPYVEGAEYPDYGCNTETFTDWDMLEVESLGPLVELAPQGGSVAHVERWYLFKADVPADEAGIDKTLLPLVEKTQPVE